LNWQRGRDTSTSVDIVDKWTIDFKSLAYNICGIYTTLLQSLAMYLFNIIHNIHKPDLLRVRRRFT
jgi:hypothetical protein